MKQSLKEAGGKVPPRRTEIVYRGCCRWVSLRFKTKPDRYPEPAVVNTARRWNEGYYSYPGRSVEPAAEIAVTVSGDTGRAGQKSAEVVVAEY